MALTWEQGDEKLDTATVVLISEQGDEQLWHGRNSCEEETGEAVHDRDAPRSPAA